MHTLIKRWLAAGVLMMGMTLGASAATITNNDPNLTLGAQIDTFAGAVSVPVPGGVSISGANATSNVALDSSVDGIFDLFMISGGFPVLTGLESQVFQDAAAGVLEVLMTAVAPSALAPSGLFLAEFTYNPLFALPGLPLTGTLTLYQVDRTQVIPLPAGLPLMLGGLALLGLAARRRRT